MKFNQDLAAIHGYLCSDGYVIKNPETQKHKYYYIGFRNTNETLLKDFQKRFYNYFKLKPIITNEGRCKIQNKAIYQNLIKDYSYYSYEWTLPKLNKNNLKLWLRAFFDAEGWVENYPKKSRMVRLDSCNEAGIFQIQEALKKYNISSTIRKIPNRTIWRLNICSKESIISFQKYINFLHPKKKAKLQKAINSYNSYIWEIPKTKLDLFQFIETKGKANLKRKEIRFTSIKKSNLILLEKALNRFQIKSKLFGPWKNNTGSEWYQLTIKEALNETNNSRTSSRNQKNR